MNMSKLGVFCRLPVTVGLRDLYKPDKLLAPNGGHKGTDHISGRVLPQVFSLAVQSRNRNVYQVFPSPDYESLAPLCVGCGDPILDQFILRVSPDLSWHAACLKVISREEDERSSHNYSPHSSATSANSSWTRPRPASSGRGRPTASRTT